MAEPQIIPFVIWSSATLAIALVAGFVYRIYLRRNIDAKTPS